jgi:hypothetical protein
MIYLAQKGWYGEFSRPHYPNLMAAFDQVPNQIVEALCVVSQLTRFVGDLLQPHRMAQL